ncbi:MAG: SDR family oxidoreductase [Alphaproteobacteria bacterium]|nr:SDR family oxidoreductase [Alphaproteobacteria bacterium]
MKIMVTGANGFVGRSLCAHLRAANHQLVAMVRTPASLAEAPVAHNLALAEVIVGDLADGAPLQASLSGVDTVIHLAARVHIMRDDSPDPMAAFHKINVDGTMHLAKQAHQAGVRRLVFLSSIKVNGESGHFTETDNPAPTDAYALSKWQAEQALKEFSQQTGMEVVIIRPPLIYGPGVKGNFASLIRLIQRGWPLPLGAVHNQRSLIALDNLVGFIALCADRDRSPAAANQTFLLSDGADVSTTQLLQKLGQAYGKRPWLIPMPTGLMRLAARLIGKKSVADRLFDSLTVDSGKAQGLLAWRPVVTMDQQFAKMAMADSGGDSGG